ncbi:MAG: hypothetical protein ACREMY_05060 [bacterium]
MTRRAGDSSLSAEISGNRVEGYSVALYDDGAWVRDVSKPGVYDGASAVTIAALAS